MANTVNVTKANTFEQWRVKTNELGTALGDLDTLTASDSSATTVVAALNVHDTSTEAAAAAIGTIGNLWDTTNYGALVLAVNKNHSDIGVIAGTAGISLAGSSLSGYNGSETTLIAILNAQRAVDITSTAGVATNVTNIAAVNTKLGTISAAAMGTSASTVGPAILELHGELTTATSNIAGLGTSFVAVAGDTMTGLLTVREASGASPGIRAATALTLGAGSGTTMTMNASQRLGIGTAPHGSHKVDVSGNLNATTLSYGGTDLATKFVTAGEVFEDTVGAMFDGTETGGISATYNDTTGNIDLAIANNGHNHTVANVTGFDAQVHALVGAMVTSNTESGIGVTYEAGDQTLDFNVNDPTITLTGDVTGAGTMTNLGSFSIATTRTAASTSTADIANGAVTTIKLGDLQVTAAKIANNTITEAKMANDSIGSAEMKTLSTLLIINSAGATVKTLHGAGA
jgi:hypothetical protein